MRTSSYNFFNAIRIHGGNVLLCQHLEDKLIAGTSCRIAGTSFFRTQHGEVDVQLIQDFSKSDSIIYEPFCGSGTTMVAAHQLNRKCYGMELSEKYCQVIINRMRKLDPTLIIKRNGVIYE